MNKEYKYIQVFKSDDYCEMHLTNEINEKTIKNTLKLINQIINKKCVCSVYEYPDSKLIENIDKGIYDYSHIYVNVPCDFRLYKEIEI